MQTSIVNIIIIIIINSLFIRVCEAVAGQIAASQTHGGSDAMNTIALQIGLHPEQIIQVQINTVGLMLQHELAKFILAFKRIIIANRTHRLSRIVSIKHFKIGDRLLGRLGGRFNFGQLRVAVYGVEIVEGAFGLRHRVECLLLRGHIHRLHIIVVSQIRLALVVQRGAAGVRVARIAGEQRRLILLALYNKLADLVQLGDFVLLVDLVESVDFALLVVLQVLVVGELYVAMRLVRGRLCGGLFRRVFVLAGERFGYGRLVNGDYVFKLV